MSSAKKLVSTILVFALVLCILPSTHAQAAETPEATYYVVEDLGDGITVETTVEVYPSIARNNSKSAISVSDYKNRGEWIATVAFKVSFTYNGMTAGVTSTEYDKSLASGWSYTNHKITRTTLSTSDGGTAVLTATLTNFPFNVAIRHGLHCAPDGTITKV